MPIDITDTVDVFLSYLKASNKIMTISKDGVTLKNVHIDYFMVDNNDLLIHTWEAHEIRTELDDFQEVAFDAIAARAPADNIKHCLECLEDKDHFSAYFMNSRNERFLSFFQISDGNSKRT